MSRKNGLERLQKNVEVRFGQSRLGSKTLICFRRFVAVQISNDHADISLSNFLRCTKIITTDQTLPESWLTW